MDTLILFNCIAAGLLIVQLLLGVANYITSDLRALKIIGKINNILGFIWILSLLIAAILVFYVYKDKF